MLSIVLVMVLLITVMSLSIAAEDIGALEDTYVNVYDAQSLGTALATEGANIVLWSNITYSDAATIACNSLDLNGYTLTCTKRMTIQKNSEFTILDSVYDSESQTSTGGIKMSKGISMVSAYLVIQSGVVDIKDGGTAINGVGSGDFTIIDGKVNISGTNGIDGITGSNGENGLDDTGSFVYNTEGKCGENGTNGSNGYDAVNVENVIIYKGTITIIGGNGGSGGAGGHGGRGGNALYGPDELEDGEDGGDGGHGGNAGEAGAGIVAESVTIYGGNISITGGAGGNGGRGGSGGKGGNASDYDCYTSRPASAGGGGDGGNGGYNSHGREGVKSSKLFIYGGEITISGGRGSTAGAAGKCGENGLGGEPWDYGHNGTAGVFNGFGGAGINAEVTINGGLVNVIGGTCSAAIGGSGYSDNTNGKSVIITGGKVVVQAGNNGFDIGGGYDGSSYGAPGTLEVSGGTIEFHTSGKATNVSNPIFKNCTVSGTGAYNHEGTYNENGKFSISVTDITINPADCVGYDSVTLTASLKISRSTNITTPASKGYISFKLDGKEIGIATIENSNLVENQIVANASIDWIAVEGNHIIIAEYIAGTNDKYASAGALEFNSNIAAHTHDWDEDFTVDVKPTCLTVGSKSIHCKICNAQKDITEIPEIGHNYVNNQCENCKEFLPLIVFKDYDGTILSSNYYYIGDTISVPDAPTRLEDNTYTYTFIGWDQEIIECNGDRVYTAVYELIFKNYTITFKNWDNTVLLTKDDYHYGDVVTPPTLSPTKPSDKIGDYIFTSWDSPVGNCDGDKIYTAIYSISYKYYTVEFRDWNNQIISSNTYKYGEVIEVPENPNKQADMVGSYIFNGWDKNITVCDGNKVYIATYLTNYIDYMITFKDWDNSIINTKTIHYGDVVTAPDTPTRNADNTYTYTFKGWDKEVVACAGDATYTATYNSTYIDYTVTFKNEDGSILSSDTYHYGESVVAPSTPSKAANNTYAYTFAGWDSEVVACNGNKTYTATYTPVYIEYTVVFKDWNGNEISSNEYHYGQTVTKPSNPTREADNTYTYAFAGWDKIITSCTESTVYTATYSSTYIDYEIVFKNYDGSILSSETYHYGDAVVVPETPTKPADESYTYGFAGWDSEVTACLGNKIYTATFNPINVEYTVVFKDWNGNIISSETYYFGAEVVVPENPTRNADNIYTYTFKNWGKTVAEICVGDAEYTANYEATHTEYNIKFLDWDGSLIQTVKYHYGDTITAIADPERASDETYTYTFLSWNKAFGTCTGNASFTAQYESTFINYTVVFKDYDGSVISRKTYHFGDPITIPADPVRASDDTYSYTFKDWGNISTSCNGNKEYTANYDAIYIDYTVVFKNHDGSVISTKTYHYGDAVSDPEAPTKVADSNYTYTFKAWDKEVVACVGDAVYTAVYTSTKIESNDSTTSTTDNTTDKSDENKVTETDAKANSGCGGCGSSTALSALAIVAVIGSAIVIKKKED